MSKYTFLFDLDSTVTREEILPKISIKVNKQDEMRKLTEMTMNGEMPFRESFLNRVKLLSEIPVDYVQNEVANIKLNEKLVEFLKQNRENCYIVTGNLDVWICKLMEKIGMENNYFCSKAIEKDNRLVDVVSVVDKKEVVSQFQNIIAVGDGNNDAEMISMAEVGIGFGGVRNIAPAVLEVCTHAIYDEEALVAFLNRFV
ncbi:MAG: HAD-IB family phosphatase [Clostridia bacterium]|nr:HAD-IB family phosphatase [Clostridia bacterium]